MTESPSKPTLDTRQPPPWIPGWARAYFERHTTPSDRNVCLLSDPDELPHRREAFYRLLCTNNPDMRAMWKRADKVIHEDRHQGFIGSLILSTDGAIGAITGDERIPPRSGPTPAKPERMRDPAKTLARKLARDLGMLSIVTPARCLAFKAVQRVGVDVERLIIYYRFQQAQVRISTECAKLGIEYTPTSKRGWVQCRRASDTMRAKVVKAARKLARIGHQKNALWLTEIADTFAQLPSIDDEHGDDVELRSQKSGWGDWLRIANEDMQDGVYRGKHFLTLANWAALVQALFHVAVSKEQIAQALQLGKSVTGLAEKEENH